MTNTLRDLIIERDRLWQTCRDNPDSNEPAIVAARNAYLAANEQVQAHPVMRAIDRLETDSYTPNATMIDALIAAVEAESPTVARLRGLLTALLEYSQHTSACAVVCRDQLAACTCGLTEIVRRAVGSGTAAEHEGE